MMRWLFLLLMLAPAAAYGKQTSKYAKNALEFNYRGIEIGATFEQCEKTLGEPTEVDPFRNVAKYNQPNGEGRWTNITIENGRVRSISALLTSEEVESIGGEPVIQVKLVEKYGRPVEEKPGVFTWKFKKANRLIAYAAKEKTVVITVQLLNPELAEPAGSATNDQAAQTQVSHSKSY